MIERAEYTQAEQLLAGVQAPQAYDYLYTEIRGDLALARGNQMKAASAYKKALDQVPDKSMNVSLLMAKYESVSAAGDIK
jgi:predicted negative regulator of RcsB-dependent stress response